MKEKILVFFLVLLPVVANLYFLKPELSILSDVNDNVFAYALAERMDQAWDEGNCPWNLPKCLPKLTDHWVSYWAMGYPLPHYYQHLPSIVNVALFKALNTLGFIPNTTTALEANNFLLSSNDQQLLTNDQRPTTNDYQNPGLFTVFNWTKYLILCFYPLTIFWSARKFKFPKIAAGFCALISTLIATNFQYGTDYGSLIWRGSGMYTQLWGIFFLPLTVASIYDTIVSANTQPLTTNNLNLKPINVSRYLNILVSYLKTPHLTRSIILLAFTFQAHVLYGYMASLSAVFIILVQLIGRIRHLYLIGNKEMSKRKTEISHFGKIFSRVIDLALYLIRLIRKPVIILACVYLFSFLLLSYWLIPLFINDAYHAKSVWDELYKFDSFGAREVINRYFGGEIFDYGRFPVFTILVFTGFFFGLNKFFEVGKGDALPSKASPLQKTPEASFENSRNYPSSYLFFPLLLIFWTLLYFGRTTWGPLINLLPGSEGIHMHRFINGVHFAGIFLGGLGLYWLSQKIQIFLILIGRLFSLLGKLPDPENPNNNHQNINFNIKQYLFSPHVISPSENFLLLTFNLLLTILILYPAVKERLDFVNHNAYLINFYNTEYKKDFVDFGKVMAEIKKRQNAGGFTPSEFILSKVEGVEGPGRIWAGRPGNWGRNFKVGGTESYLTLSVNGFDTIGFEPESWSPNTDLEQFFNDQRLDHYNLFNIRYIIAPPEVKFPNFAKKINTYGKYVLYTVPTNGNFDFINSDLNIYGDKYNTLNFVRFWLDSKWPQGKNHPQVLYREKYDSQVKSFQIVDWTSFKWLPEIKNEALPLSLLANNPFNATPSSVLSTVIPDKLPSEATRSGIYSNNLLKNEIVKNDYYAVKTETAQPSLLLLKATFHPFWQAKLTNLTTNDQRLMSNDQRQATISMYSPYFMGINIPAGKYKIEFTYEAKPYKKLLLLISLATLILIIVLPGLSKSKKTK